MPMTVSGVDATLKVFEKAGKDSEGNIKKAVKAGAKLLAEKLKAAAPVKTGGLRDSIKAGTVKYNAADGYHCEVKPNGNDSDGESYAKIGNVLEYGKSTMPAKAWFNPTIKECEREVLEAMRAEFERLQGGGGK